VQKVQPKEKAGCAEVALRLISKFYCIEIIYKQGSDEARKRSSEFKYKGARELKAWMLKAQSYVMMHNTLGEAVTWLANKCYILEP
jgi:hypothetical protein